MMTACKLITPLLPWVDLDIFDGRPRPGHSLRRSGKVKVKKGQIKNITTKKKTIETLHNNKWHSIDAKPVCFHIAVISQYSIQCKKYRNNRQSCLMLYYTWRLNSCQTLYIKENTFQQWGVVVGWSTWGSQSDSRGEWCHPWPPHWLCPCLFTSSMRVRVV